MSGALLRQVLKPFQHLALHKACIPTMVAILTPAVILISVDSNPLHVAADPFKQSRSSLVDTTTVEYPILYPTGVQIAQPAVTPHCMA